uniref:Protein kinase domain-containing protein n=1 Tax=Macrostomum lignano TaxID=282301 RepID=A0A1I8J1H0_9PLAT
MDRQNQQQQQQQLSLPGLTIQKADPLSVFEIAEYIGRGTYGVVRRARMKTSGRICAVKIMNDGQDIVEELRAEVRVLTQFVDHPNLPRFYGLYLDRSSAHQTIWLAMELCEGGSVASLSKYHSANSLAVPEPVVAHIAGSALSGLAFLHSNRIIHRDVKCANVLLTKDGRVLLSDFGVSAHLKEVGEKRNTAIGSPFWMSPEVIACENQPDYRYDNRCDVWSLGISVIELCEGQPPLAELPPIKALFRIPSDPPPTLRRPERYTALLRDFIAKCLVKDYEIRPAASELRSHLFLASQGGASTTGQDPVAMIRKLIADKTAWEAGGSGQSPAGVVAASAAAGPVGAGKGGGGRKSRRLLAQTRWDDLAQLSHLTEDGILQQLSERYSSDMVYTYLGDILLAINPFKQLPIYSDAVAERYRDAAKADNPPHVFAVADECLQRLRQCAGARGQCVVISGESGAGKTCTADLLLRQVVRLSSTEQPALMERLLQVNPLLEAFGNASTVLNENSSRFGKYLELLVSPTGCIRGARLAHFLLEKARVVYQSKGERNFHIFYHLAHGDSHEHATLLARQTDFRYLHATFAPDSGRAAVHRAHLSAVRRGFLDLGFAETEVSSVFRLLSGILFLGNLRFNDHVQRSNADIATDSSKVANPEAASAAADLLGVSSADLADALTKTSLVARGESIQKFHSPADARASRDAMAKAVYDKLFSWIVQRTNDLLAPAASASGSTASAVSSIGILDIFGFENLSFNSFEQLCINTANEQLHYFFIQHVFNWERHELEQEGINVNVQVYDNKPVLDLLLGRPYGLLALLDEECSFPKASDLSLTEKLHKHAAEKYPRLYQQPKSATDLAFTVRHYAGHVTYSTQSFLSKNKDRLPVEIAALLRGSNLALLRSLFAQNVGPGGVSGGGNSSAAVSLGRPGSSGSTLVTPLSSAGLHKLSSGGSSVAGSRITGQTLAAYFRASLHDLLNRLLSAEPHFVRCLRPNREGRPDRIEPDKVLEQLRYTGVLETVEIRRQGYSHRLSFREFLAEYGPLVLGFSPVSRGASAGQAAMDLCRTVLKKLGLTGWLVGRHKVFLKYYHVELLIRRRAHLLAAVTRCQAAARRWLAMRRLRQMRWSLMAARRVV